MLTAGTLLGPYEIVAPLGSGGMGEVYRAWDPKLSRLVAIKVLAPGLASDLAALARFEREARAVAALSHPNILGIYDFGSEAGAAYAVMELLEGETLRERLNKAGPRSSDSSASDPGRGASLPSRKVVNYALQIASGLAAAHERGIVHRDLKPENIFITKDGRVKILDFGLAQVLPAAGSDPQATVLRSMTHHTQPGTVLGTVGYMSPEQVRGRSTDHRSDIFSFGTILYEMFAGRRAFGGESAADTMTAILKEDPPPLSTMTAGLPPALERIVQRCLEKTPEERFQSARDLAFALDALSTASVSSVRAGLVDDWIWPRRFRLIAIGALSLAAAFVMGAMAARWYSSTPPTPAAVSFQRLSFGRGSIRAARFTPDGQSVVYGAAWSGQPLRMFLTRPESLGVSPLTLPDGLILAISPRGELAVSVGHRFDSIWMGAGTLARGALLGGGLREMLQHVRAADWAPDGERLAVVRRAGERERLEYPPGKVIYQTTGYISHPRVAPDGNRVAFLDHSLYGDNRGVVAIIDSTGSKTTLTREWPSVEGLAWSPSGREVWFTASAAGEDHAIYGIAPNAQLRSVYRAPAALVLQDVSRDGRALVTQEQFRGEISVLAPGASQERDLSLLDLSGARDISGDGRLLLITQFGTGSGGNYAVYLQNTDGSPAVRLGDGEAVAISPDQANVLAILHGPPSRLVVLPTGAGEVRTLAANGLSHVTAAWFPNGRRVLTCGTMKGQGPRCYVMDVETSGLRPVTPEGVRVERLVRPRISPDGRTFVAVGPEGRAVVYPVDGGAPQPIPGVSEGETAIEWTSDGLGLYVHKPSGVPRQVWRIDLKTGQRTLWREIVPSDPAGVLANLEVLITPDGRAYATVFYRLLSTLYLATGLK